MAPKRGGGSSGSYSSCPDAFATTLSQASFSYTVVFLAIFLGIAVALCCVRKRSGSGKKLVGPPYSVALLFMIIATVLDLISTVMIQCDRLAYSSYSNLIIASNIFYGLGDWGLFFVVTYQLNTMLRAQYGGSNKVFKVVPLVIVAVMFAFTVGYLGLSNYNIWTRTDAGYSAGRSWIYGTREMQLARSVLYLSGLVASGALSMMTIFAMRSRSLPGGDLIGWVVALYISMAIWMLLSVVFAAQHFNDYELRWQSTTAMSYVNGFFNAFSFIILLCIAKHVSWNKTTATTSQAYAPVMQQQTAYGGYPTNGQHEYYQQAPVYVQPK